MSLYGSCRRFQLLFTKNITVLNVFKSVKLEFGSRTGTGSTRFFILSSSLATESTKRENKKVVKMGITGLLPFLKKASKNTHLKHYRGYSAAVDGLCWLHKGAFGCAQKLGLGEATDAYVVYFMKYVNVLLQHGIRPVIVFDGRSLVSKEPTNKKRREYRAENRKKAKDCMRRGDKKGAWEYFVRSIEITHEMILEVIKVLRKQHIDYIVAPFEADPQLAYLSRQGIVDLVITEDSDLTLFGCPQILFKLKMDGSCVIFNQAKIHLCMEVTPLKFQFEKFRHMAMLSGCDYLESLPGIGLVRAKKIINAMTSPDIKQALKALPSTLGLNIDVPDEYIEGFFKAENTFLYQLVFDPLTRKLAPLNPYLMNVDPKEIPYAGTYDLDNKAAFSMALGNIHTRTLQEVDKYNVDTDKGYANKATSIWSKKYRIPPTKNPIKDLKKETKHSSTKGLKATVSIKNLNIKKRPLAMDEDRNDGGIEQDSDLLALYAEEDDDNNSKTLLDGEGKGSQEALDGTVPQKGKGQPSQSKRVKITAGATMSLRNSDTYNMRTTRNTASSSAVEDNCAEEFQERGDHELELQQTENSPRKHLKKNNPFVKSPDIGLRARAKINGLLELKVNPMRNRNLADHNEKVEDSEDDGPPYVDLVRIDSIQTKDLKKGDPFCLVEKNHIYDLDAKLIVRSKYFRPQPREAEEVRSENVKTLDDKEDVAPDSFPSQNSMKFSQLSIYSIDNESLHNSNNSESQNLNNFLDIESQNLNEEFSNISNHGKGKAASVPSVLEPEIVTLNEDDDDSENDGAHSSYFNGGNGFRKDLRKSPRHPSSQSPSAFTSASSQSKKGVSSGKKAAGKSPGRKGNGGKLTGTCRQHGLKKAPIKSSAGQKTIKEMFAYKPKAKI